MGACLRGAAEAVPAANPTWLGLRLGLGVGVGLGLGLELGLGLGLGLAHRHVSGTPVPQEVWARVAPG